MNEPTSNTPLDDSPAAPAPEDDGTRFLDLGLGAEVMRALADMGFERPMKVQALSIPLILAGRDLLVQSRTGSGKTAAFGIPIIDRVVDPAEKAVQAIILLPTRELALQVAAELTRISTHKPTTVVPIYGGAPMGKQIEQLKAGGQIVCGTPGRILDHLRRGTLTLDRVRCAVLDECDEMLSMGFQEDIEAILEHAPKERQTLLYSATVPAGIERLSRRFLRDPERLKLSVDFVGVHEIAHVYYQVSGQNREADLLTVLQFEDPVRAIVFCNTRDETGRVAEFLRSRGLEAAAISSDLVQADRERVMARMRAGEIQYLVATDVAARGIDLDKISHVVNYTFPESAEVYIHRTGRTGRAGRHGVAVSLIGPAEVGAFYHLKLLYKIKPKERSLPSPTEIQAKREGELLASLRARFPTDPGPGWRSLARRLATALDGERLFAALLADNLAGARKPGQAERHAVHPPEAQAETPRRPDDNGAARSGERPPETHGGSYARERPERARERPAREREPRRGLHEERGRGRGYGERHGRQERGRPSQPTLTPEAERAAVQAPAASALNDDFSAIWRAEPEASGAPAGASERQESALRPQAGSGPSAGQQRLYLNLGRKDRATADEIADLAASAGITVPLHDIDVMNTHTYLNVASEDAERLVAALAGRERQGRRLSCEPARPRRS